MRWLLVLVVGLSMIIRFELFAQNRPAAPSIGAAPIQSYKGHPSLNTVLPMG